MPLHRKPNWQFLLDLYLRAKREQKFSYGRFDCCLFACDAIAEMTFVDPAEHFRGKYSNRKEAYREIEAYAGHASVQAVAEKIAAEYGMPEVAPLKAQRGDVVLLLRDSDFSLALIGLRGELLAAGRRGVIQAPMRLAVRAWHV